MPDLPDGTVTLLFTDIEGSTRLLHELGPQGYAVALAEHRRLVRDAFAAHGGVEVDTQGDAFFYAFADATAGVAGAAAAQAGLADGPVRVRMGLHTGTPTRAEHGYVGEDVHLGARIAAAGHGGQVLLSAAPRAALDVGHDLVLADLGEHQVKDFDEAVWLFQLGAGAFPPLKTIANTNLPRPASSFVGREREAEEVESLLREARLVTLTGPGGSRKTRLAIEAASSLVGELLHGVFWVGLATIRDPELVVPAIAQAIGAQGELAAEIGEKELLLLLENLEQVVEAAPELAELVEACPNLRLLVTSRELLRVRGEVEYEVLPLADPDAVELFCDRARLAPTSAVGELCRRLDNMPLALELAAARTKALSPEQILDRLSQRLDLFKGGRDADARQRTLRATIEWSYDLLSPDEHQVFRRLGVFAGGCTLEAAETVCDSDLDTLQSLVEKSLLRHTNERFWMLETIREYATERLEESGEADATRLRHAEFFLELARSANLTAEAEGGRRHDLVVPERANLRAAIDWCLVAGNVELGLELAVALENFWVAENPFEGIRTFEALLRSSAEVPQILRARALRCYGGSSFIAGQYEQAQRASEESLALFRRSGTDRDVAVMLHRLAMNALALDDLAPVRPLLKESLSIFTRVGSRRGEAEAIGSLGYLAKAEGDLEQAIVLFRESAGMVRELRFPWWLAGMLSALAECSLALGRADEAATYVREQLLVSRGIGDRQALAFGLAHLAWVAAERQDVARAGRLWGAVEGEAERAPLGQWEGEREQLAGHVLKHGGLVLEAARAAGRTLTLDEAVDEALADG